MDCKDCKNFEPREDKEKGCNAARLREIAAKIASHCYSIRCSDCPLNDKSTPCQILETKSFIDRNCGGDC